MTFSILGFCKRTNAYGVALASSPYTVASRCPFARGGVAALSTQAFTNPTLGPIMLDMLADGVAPEAVIEKISQTDEHFGWRQIGIVTRDGKIAVHSGSNGNEWTGHVTGDGFIAMGNTIVGPQVVEAMAKSFADNPGELLEERLMRALEAGSDAGGEAKGQLSAGILVCDDTQLRPRTDLRVEMANPTPPEGGNAVNDLRRIVTAFIPMIDYYKIWHTNPRMENWRDWQAAHA